MNPLQSEPNCLPDKSWHIFTGNGNPHEGIEKLPLPPRWRAFEGNVAFERPVPKDETSARRFLRPDGERSVYHATPKILDMVNAALYLRRPLVVTGKPGTGKSTLAHAVAWELKLGPVLNWPITSRVVLQEALYRYDALGRLEEVNMLRLRHKNEDESLVEPDIGQYIRLGPVGTAFLPSKRPRVLLIDELDKSDIDLPNDLLHLFEEGSYEIPELARLAKKDSAKKIVHVLAADGTDTVAIQDGRVTCTQFPFVVITSNGERELPTALLRRCLRLDIEPPTVQDIEAIIETHFGVADEATQARRATLIKEFFEAKNTGHLATDQLLNAIYLAGRLNRDFETIKDDVLRQLER